MIKIYFLIMNLKINKEVKVKKFYCVNCGKYRKFKNPNNIFSIKQLFLLFVISVAVSLKYYLKKKNQLNYVKL